jgi:hypothetical protein
MRVNDESMHSKYGPLITSNNATDIDESSSSINNYLHIEFTFDTTGDYILDTRIGVHILKIDPSCICA